MTALPDESLDASLARLARGDRSAFTTVFRELWPRTLRLCTGILKNEADAADAAQQALSKILERASEYDPERPAQTLPRVRPSSARKSQVQPPASRTSSRAARQSHELMCGS
jgi:hypothetical protein